MALQERLTGLVLVLIGLAGMTLVYLYYQHRDVLPQPPTPPGMTPRMVPLFSPLECIMPLAAFGSAALIFMGLRRMVFPETFGPD